MFEAPYICIIPAMGHDHDLFLAYPLVSQSLTMHGNPVSDITKLGTWTVKGVALLGGDPRSLYFRVRTVFGNTFNSSRFNIAYHGPQRQWLCCDSSAVCYCSMNVWLSLMTENPAEADAAF